MTFGSYFKEEQKEQMVKQLQALLEEVDENLKESFKNVHQGNPTETLLRFLKASDWNVQRALKVLLDCLQWRVLQNNFDKVFAKHLIPIYRAVGDSQIMGLYSKESPMNRNHKLGSLVGSDKVYVNFEGCESYICQHHEEAVMKRLYAESKTLIKIADFERLDEEYNKSDGSYVPSYLLDYVAEAIGGDTAAGFIYTQGLVQVTNENCQLPRDREYVDVREVVKCVPCIRVEALLGEKLKSMKNKFGKLDFQSFPQGWKASDGNNVPPYLEYVYEAIGRNITATATLISKDIIAHTGAYVYAAIDEMHNMQLVDITDENVMLKWGCVMRDAKKMGLDVEFAEDHLKKVAHSYFQSKEPAAESNKEEHVICSMSESNSFEDGAPLTKGLLLFAPSEHSA